ncbi:MAG: erythromycin biosynthesis sensory transduction protein eryC1 [Gammaproteobacteria bacterium]|nr:MAG: erythromycin biosynthesis sensory transduction protein eryC1 [Gammaproteobacteria bacterium]
MLNSYPDIAINPKQFLKIIKPENQQIKFLDLPSQYAKIQPQIEQVIDKVINNSAFIGGEYVAKFEKKFAVYQDADFCVGVANGTDALEIAIEAFDLPKNSEIIVPANSFIASSEAVTRCGHKVVFCDCNKHNYTISIKSLQEKITRKTAAIIAVHIYGHPADMDELLKIAKTHNLKIIEDCAQSHGGTYKNQKIGAIGDIGAFSFYPGKNLGAYGDGGAITTNNQTLAKKCKMIANHGRVEKYNHQFEGRNSRLDAIQAAILSIKLKYLDNWTDARIKVADYYLKNLKNVDGIVLPKRESWAKQVYHLFVVRVKNRDKLQEYLKQNNITTGVHYPISLPKLQAYKYVNQYNQNFFANQSDKELLSLPIGEHLTEQDLAKIVTTIKVFYENSD